MTFTLAGFNLVKREGIQLTGTSVTTVNTELRVGEVAETITVTGAAPIVDVQSVRTQQTIPSEVIAALPTGRTMLTLAATLPGVSVTTRDVGGTNNLAGALGTASVHGSLANDIRIQLDGLSLGMTAGTGGWTIRLRTWARRAKWWWTRRQARPNGPTAAS